jgi:hypothetical protein
VNTFWKIIVLPEKKSDYCLTKSNQKIMGKIKARYFKHALQISKFFQTGKKNILYRRYQNRNVQVIYICPSNTPAVRFLQSGAFSVVHRDEYH